jgi:NADH:ubiquinone oxidoreductase subunit C
MTLLDELSTFFACALREIQDTVREELNMRLIPRDDLAVTVPKEVLHAAVARLVTHCGLNHLTAITAIDEGETIQLKYHLWQGHGLTLEIALPINNLEIPTITDIVPGAAFYEREVYGMYGVHFTGHPDLRPLLLPDAWQGPPPLRKEYEDG